jgi:hypothetical protein
MNVLPDWARAGVAVNAATIIAAQVIADRIEHLPVLKSAFNALVLYDHTPGVGGVKWTAVRWSHRGRVGKSILPLRKNT